MLAGNTAYAPPVYAFESIATVSVGSGGSSSVEFTSIPSTYTHLQIRFNARGSRSLFLENLRLSFNSDTTTANYRMHAIYGDGANVTATQDSNTELLLVYSAAGNNAGSNVFGAGVIDILDYANTNKNKTIRALAGVDNNGQGIVALTSGARFNTAAITSIKIDRTVGADWLQYSHFSLYGIKSA
jgi:hypothetical protein